MAIDKEILEDFKKESKSLVEILLDLLEQTETDPTLVKNLESYGQTVDRIMGGAKSLATNFASDFPSGHMIHQMGDYAALCKTVGYKASQIIDNEPFINVCVAFLLDATETLQQMIQLLGTETGTNITRLLNKTFLDRLRWIDSHFTSDMRATVASSDSHGPKKMKQSEIDDLLKKLGIGN